MLLPVQDITRVAELLGGSLEQWGEGAEGLDPHLQVCNPPGWVLASESECLSRVQSLNEKPTHHTKLVVIDKRTVWDNGYV